jgi:hypothetical protein
MVTQAEIQDYAKRLRKEADADEWQCRVADLLLAAYAEPPAPREPTHNEFCLRVIYGERTKCTCGAAAPSEIARDAARWIEDHQATVTFHPMGRTGEDKFWSVEWQGHRVYGDTLRAAIDAAIEQEGDV